MKDTLSELTTQIMALPTSDRADLAQQLWESLHTSEEIKKIQQQDAIQTAESRDADLSQCLVAGRTHEQVMNNARQATQCE